MRKNNFRSDEVLDGGRWLHEQRIYDSYRTAEFICTQNTNLVVYGSYKGNKL